MLAVPCLLRRPRFLVVTEFSVNMTNLRKEMKRRSDSTKKNERSLSQLERALEKAMSLDSGGSLIPRVARDIVLCLKEKEPMTMSTATMYGLSSRHLKSNVKRCKRLFKRFPILRAEHPEDFLVIKRWKYVKAIIEGKRSRSRHLRRH